MAPRHREVLDGGLVTIRDAALLDPGQLSALRNAVYKPGTKALHRATGRSQFATASAGVDVNGLRDLKFDNDIHTLIAHVSGHYLSAAVGDTGTFGTLASGVGNGSQLEVVQYRNRFFLFNGVGTNATAVTVNSNRVVYLSATAASAASFRQHGMLPVPAGPETSTASGVFSQTVTGYYEYWTTEVASSTQDGADFSMEGTFVGTPTTVYVSSTAVVPRINRPDIRNPAAATHWRIWRSVKKDRAADKLFPVGFLIAEVSTGATSVQDTQTVASASAFPSNFNGVGDGASVFADWTNAARMSADDGSYASAPSTALANIKIQGVYGFNLGGFTGPVKGIEVVIDASATTTASLGIGLVRGRQSDGGIVPSTIPPFLRNLAGEMLRKLNTANKTVNITASSVYTLGSSADRWFASDVPPPVDTTFNTNFMVTVGFSSPAAATAAIDYLKLIVYYGGTLDSVIPFPTVIYNFGDISAQVGKNGPPPDASCGDVYEDTLVVNDVGNPGLIRYSFAGDPEAFPPTYYIDFETRENDRVSAIKVVNDVLCVWLTTSTWRVNYLPSERDASFDRGKAKSVISSQYGCVNPMCVCLFTPDGGAEQAAWVSDKGIHTTDGNNFHTRTGQLNWRGIISSTTTSTPIALINDSENQRLCFFFRNDTYTPETYLRLDLSYAKGDVDEEGNFKAGGFVHMRNFSSSANDYATLKSAWPIRRSTGETQLFLGYGGTVTAAGGGYVYRETGSSLPVNDSTMKWSTRDMFLAGEGSEWRANELYFFVGSYDNAPAFQFTPRTTKTNDTGGRVSQGSKSRTLGGERLAKVQFNQVAEGMILDAVVTASAAQVEYLLIDGAGFGEEDSGVA